MIIEITEKYQLRACSDKLNWELWKLSKDKKGEPKWLGMGRYYQDLAQALKAVYERELKCLEGSYDLPGAIKQARAIEREITQCCIDLRKVQK